MSREESLRKKRCQKIRMPRERHINGKRPKSHWFQETAMTLEKHVSGLGLHSCQQKGLSRFRDDKGKPDQEKVATSEKNAERKKCQGQRAPRACAVNGRDDRAARLPSYRESFSL